VQKGTVILDSCLRLRTDLQAIHQFAPVMSLLISGLHHEFSL